PREGADPHRPGPRDLRGGARARGAAARRDERGAHRSHHERAALPGLSGPLGEGLALADSARDARAGRGARERGSERRSDPGRVPCGVRRLGLALSAGVRLDGARLARSARGAGRWSRPGRRPVRWSAAGARHRRADGGRDRDAARSRRARRLGGHMTIALFLVFLALGAIAVLSPYRVRRLPWPTDPPDARDDVARAVSSLRDLEFARAAGTIAPADYARLRGTLESGAVNRAPADARAPAPVRTLLIAALIASVAAAVATVTLPREAGDRAPGAPVTGSVPSGPSLASLEARAKASPRDIPTQLALADEYAQEGRARDAIAT